MKLRTKTLGYGAAGLALAGAIIFSGSALGFLNASSSGVLSVLLTDPPNVPDGVSAVYITYANVAVHAVGFGDGGWVGVSGSGTIDTMKLVNLSQTISSGVIPSLTYNLIAFNITGASVNYMGKNYSAAVGSERLTVPLVGGLKVNTSASAAALVDIQPTVLDVGTQTAPEFTLAAGARALQVPSGEVDHSMESLGHTFGLQGHGWFESFKAHHSDSFTISGVTLTASSFSFSAANDGSDAVALRMVVISPVSSHGGGHGALDSVAEGVVFTVGADGSLDLLSGAPMEVGSMLEGSGFSLAPGATHAFSYSGTVGALLGGQGIRSGTNYTVAIIGLETLSVQTVTAT